MPISTTLWKKYKGEIKLDQATKISVITIYLKYYFPIKPNNVFLFQSYDNGLAQGAGLESHGKAS